MIFLKGKFYHQLIIQILLGLILFSLGILKLGGSEIIRELIVNIIVSNNIKVYSEMILPIFLFSSDFIKELFSTITLPNNTVAFPVTTNILLIFCGICCTLGSFGLFFKSISLFTSFCLMFYMAWTILTNYLFMDVKYTMISIILFLLLVYTAINIRKKNKQRIIDPSTLDNHYY